MRDRQGQTIAAQTNGAFERLAFKKQKKFFRPQRAPPINQPISNNLSGQAKPGGQHEIGTKHPCL